MTWNLKRHRFGMAVALMRIERLQSRLQHDLRLGATVSDESLKSCPFCRASCNLVGDSWPSDSRLLHGMDFGTVDCTFRWHLVQTLQHMALRWARCRSRLPRRCKGSMASPERPFGSDEWSFRGKGLREPCPLELLNVNEMIWMYISSQGYEDWTWVTSSWPHAHDRAVSGKVLPGMVLLSTPLSKTLLESLWNRTRWGYIDIGLHDLCQ